MCRARACRGPRAGGAALALALTFALSAAATPADDGWKNAGTRDGVTVFTRARGTSPYVEAMAVGVVDASAAECARVIDDLAAFPQWMPYLKEARVIDARERVVYHRVSAPLVADRDYVIQFRDTSSGNVMRRSWIAAPAPFAARAPALDGVVRVTTTDGAWSIEPAGPGRSIVRYTMFSDPGGDVPAAFANLAALAMLPDVVNAVGKRATGSPVSGNAEIEAQRRR